MFYAKIKGILKILRLYGALKLSVNRFSILGAFILFHVMIKFVKKIQGYVILPFFLLCLFCILLIIRETPPFTFLNLRLP